MRTAEDCRSITAGIITDTNTTELALLLGLLCGTYEKTPQSRFWDVCIEFLRNRRRAHS